MTNDEVLDLILNKFERTPIDQITRVTYKNGTVYEGYFQHFNDYHELLNDLKYRFVPNDKLLEFKACAGENNDNPDISSSIILEVQQIDRIEQVKKPRGKQQ